MVSKPSIAVFVHAGDEKPVVFLTACNRPEEWQLQAWLEENPDLLALVRNARALADDDEGCSP